MSYLHDLTNADVQAAMQAFEWNIYHDLRDSVFGTKDYSFKADRDRLFRLLPDINFVFELPAVPVWVPMVEMLLPVEVDVRLAKVNVPGTRGVVFSVGWHDHHTANSITNLKHKG